MQEATRHTGAEPIMHLRHWSKTFPGTKALTNVSMTVEPGEIHALIGQNGSGKSTLLKVLAGYHHPDKGSELWLRGEQVSLPVAPGVVAHYGISVVHQDLGLADGLSVVDNVLVARFEGGLLHKINWGRERRRVQLELDSFQLDIDARSVVGDLTPAERAIVAIVRALHAQTSDRGHLLVLDEPTSYLQAAEIERLFVVLRRLRENGTSVLLTTHRMEEVTAVADRATVLRDGRVVATFNVPEVTAPILVTALVGQELGELYPDARSQAPRAAPLFTARRIQGPRIASVSLEVRAGEIMGVTGLAGMGQEELPYVLGGRYGLVAGEISVGGAEVRVGSPRDAVRAGIAVLPADRQRDSGIQMATIRENLTLPTLSRYFHHGTLHRRQESREVRRSLATYEVRPADRPEMPLMELSGGNQQKVLLAKWLEMPTLRVLILHEPTQGVDVGSRRAIFVLIRQAADAGRGIVIVSSEHDDLAHLCDSVLVLRDGRVAAHLHGQELTKSRIVRETYVTRDSEVADTLQSLRDGRE